MFYHASPTPDIGMLEPRISNHGVPRVYFSAKRENTLVYLSNAVEKTCRENGFVHTGKWQKWASYGFTKDGLLRFEEYYENALVDTYGGVSGYLYTVEPSDAILPFANIRDAFYADTPIPVASCEFVPDALEALLAAEREGKIVILRYAQLPEKMREWLCCTTLDEYRSATPDYRFFLEQKFPYVKESERAL